MNFEHGHLDSQTFTDISPAQFEKQTFRIQEITGDSGASDRFVSNSEANEEKEGKEATDTSSGILDPSYKTFFDEISEFTVNSDVSLKQITPLTLVADKVTPNIKNLVGGASVSNIAWKSFRQTGYLRIVEALLQRGGCEVSLQHALRLLKDMSPREGDGLMLHQSQIRGLLHCAILHDHGPVPFPLGGQGTLSDFTSAYPSPSSPASLSVAQVPSSSFSFSPFATDRAQSADGPSMYGNGVRVFLALRELSHTKPD